MQADLLKRQQVIDAQKEQRAERMRAKEARNLEATAGDQPGGGGGEGAKEVEQEIEKSSSDSSSEFYDTKEQ